MTVKRIPDLREEATETDVLAVFETVSEAGEPLTADEAAAEVGCTHERAHALLEQLSEVGAVESKQMGPLTRVWWRSLSDDSRSAVRNGATERQSDTSHRSQQVDESVLERIFEASPISIVVFDRGGDVTLANERAETLLGLEPVGAADRGYDQPEWKMYRDDGTPIRRGEHPLTQVFATGEPSFGFEHWIQLSDGTERWVWGNAAPVLGEESVEQAVVGFVDATTLKERENKLTSDRRRVLELSSKTLFEPLLDAVDGQFRIDVDEVVTLQDDDAIEYVTASGVPVTTVTDALAAHDAVRNVRLLRSSGDHCRLELRVTPPTLPFVFDDLGGTVVSLAREDADSTPVVVAELPGDVDPRTAMQATKQVYPDIELRSQELHYSPQLLSDIVSEALTDRKFTVLQTAYHGGYFETPRASTGDELAEQLDITRQTFNQHLRKAEQTVYEQLFEPTGAGEH